MKAGTIVRLPDGREGTVVYHGLDGYGIKWGRHNITLGDLMDSDGNTIQDSPDVWEWFPDAMLRSQYPSAMLPCVGEEFEIVGQP